MNVGIVTFHCSYNFGSALQAFALQETIRLLGHDVRIIDYRSKDFNSYHIIRPLRPWTIPGSLVRLSPLLKRRTAFRSFWNECFSLTDERYSYLDERKLNKLQRDFDAFVCGSDQIWNLDCTNGAVGPFFLSFAGERRRVAYAPSLAHTSFSEKTFNKELISELLDRFDWLSIREEETLQLFQPLVKKKIEVVSDPTLLLAPEHYKSLISPRLVAEPYIFVYLLRDCPELVESARRAAAAGVKVLYVSERDFAIPNSENMFGIGPREFLSLIYHADSVMANSFHAVVFSVLFHKPFRTFATDSSGSRMRNLLNLLHLGGCLSTEVNPDCPGDIDWATVDDALADLKADSMDYLRRALG